MGHKHARDDVLAAAFAVASEVGLSQLSFGRVAARLGINDRTVVYYVATKDQLVTEVLTWVGGQLERRLTGVAGRTVPDHRELVRAAWPVLAHADADPLFRLFFEAAGLAAAGRSPYDALLPALVIGWVDWAADRISDAAADRRLEAETAVALLDGLLLFRQTAGADAADRAAQRACGSAADPGGS